jgi:D-glycero-alpha-D-manno-heptose-7-phosphate kinase
MIISRTPFRISFFGGGTDYPAWTRENPGAVLATTINKYCYLTCRPLPPFFEHRTRILYSRVENVKSIDEIQHPSVRETLRHLGFKEGVEIHHDGDLPARTGLGSSSTFTVGLLHALYGLQGRMPTKADLARTAIHIEQDLIHETVGCQDQVMAAYGGFNVIRFGPVEPFQVSPVVLGASRLEELQSHLMLFFTGVTRTASEIASTQVREMGDHRAEMHSMLRLVDEALSVLTGSAPIAEFGRLLDEGWRLKRSLSAKISTREIDAMYETAKRSGALGGKLLGAGGGGFLLLFAPPDRHDAVRRALKGHLHVPFRFDSQGSQIIFYDRQNLHEMSHTTE